MSRTISVYLSGGTRSGWQARILEALAVRLAPWPDLNVDVFSPTELMYDEEMTLEDQTRIQRERYEQADIIFAYLEGENTNAAGMFLEMGYATGLLNARYEHLGLQAPTPLIIFVDEHKSRFTAWVGKLTGALHVTDINKGVDALVEHIKRVGGV